MHEIMALHGCIVSTLRKAEPKTPHLVNQETKSKNSQALKTGLPPQWHVSEKIEAKA
jgi:hypothetical protein